MAGIYFHIPFCKQACFYCDFHFSTSWKYKAEMLKAFLKELEIRRSLLGNEPVSTIYFGGGTPSILEASEIQELIEGVFNKFETTDNLEITLEANPDDLNREKVRNLKSTDVNRFSVGIQSFFEEDLRWMNRAHNCEEANSAIKRIQDAGFENITLDLIYGYPLLNDFKWEKNIQTTLDLEVPHISAYSMTVESGTALGHQVRKGLEKNMDDEQSAAQFEILQDRLCEGGFEQYEISNWSKPGFAAKHNGNYWKGLPYLGIGPSAHSFDGKRIRQWNVRSNSRYLQDIESGILPYEEEILTDRDRINELIMTQLRTAVGLDTQKVLSFENGNVFLKNILKEAHLFLEGGSLLVDGNYLRLTRSGKLIADHIASQLFLT